MKLRKMTYTQAGERRQSERWYAVFVDFSESLRRLPLFTDRKASDELARKIDRLNSIRAAGDTIPPDLSRYVETMPPAVREKLAAWGILSAQRAAAGRPLVDHVADWRAALVAKGNTERHAELVTSRARKAFDACRFRVWSDLSASKLQTHLAGLRADRKGDGGKVARGISAQTFNFYLQAARQFCRWMVRDGRASESPLDHLQGLNVKTDRRHDRRAMTTDELRWFLDVTERGHVAAGNDGRPVATPPVDRHDMAPAARAMLYRLAVETGLRAGELRSLTRGSFVLDVAAPGVTIAAAYAKNRRQDTLPMRPDTAAALADHLKGKMPHALAFAVPARTDVSRMFRADLAAARSAWVADAGTVEARAERERSAFLAGRDADGRCLDFHALRHTFITGLVMGGVNPKVAQTLARHSVITLTMDRYTHLNAGDLSAALDVLPDLSTPDQRAARATGTDHARADHAGNDRPPMRLAPDLSPKSEFRWSSTEPTESGKASGPFPAGVPISAKSSGNQPVLTVPGVTGTIPADVWRSGRVVDCAGLENR